MPLGYFYLHGHKSTDVASKRRHRRCSFLLDRGSISHRHSSTTLGANGTGRKRGRSRGPFCLRHSLFSINLEDYPRHSNAHGISVICFIMFYKLPVHYPLGGEETLSFCRMADLFYSPIHLFGVCLPFSGTFSFYPRGYNRVLPLDNCKANCTRQTPSSASPLGCSPLNSCFMGVYRKLMNLTYLSCAKTTGPCPLEIISTKPTGDIDAFADKKEPGQFARL